MPSFTLSSYFSRKKSTPPHDQQSSQQQQQYPSAADKMDCRHADPLTYDAAAATIIPAEAKAEAAGTAITVEILPASNNSDAITMHIQEHQYQQQLQPSPPIATSPSFSSSFKFASVIGRRRRQQLHEPSTSSSSQQQQQKYAKSLVSVLLTGSTQNKRNKSHIFKEKDKEDQLKEQHQEQEQQRQQQEQVSEEVQQLYRAPLPDQWTTTGGSQQTQVSNNSKINNSNNMTGSWLHHNCSDLQQQQQKESKREIATTASTTTTTKMMAMRDKDEDGAVGAMSSPYKGHPLRHQELSAISPIMRQQQEKEWHQHGEEQLMLNLDGTDAVAFVSEGVWTKIKKRSALSSSPLSLTSFLFKEGDRGQRHRQRLPPASVATVGAPSQIIAAHADDDGRVLVSLTDTTKATATTTRLRSKKKKGLFSFSSVLIPATAAAKRRSSHGNLIVDSPLNSPIATMSTTHSAAVIPPRSRSIASSSFSCPPPRPPCLSNNNIIKDNIFSLFPSSSSLSPSSSPNDDTEDVEAQRSRLNAIRSNWHERFHSACDPVLISSSWLSPSHKKVQRSNTTVAVAAITNNHITKSPSQNTSNTAITTTTSGTIPTNSCRLGSSPGTNQNRYSRTSSAFLDQETTRTWRGLFASVRQLSHDTSTTGSSTHSSASTTSLSSSAQSLNEKDQSNKEKHNNQNQQHRYNRRHFKHRNSNDASALRAIGPFFARRPSSSSRPHNGTTDSLSTADLEKRPMMMTKNPPRKLTILVVGDGAVGKSALTLRFLRDQYVLIIVKGGEGERSNF